LLFAMSLANQVLAQGDCARCAPALNQPLFNRAPALLPPTTTRFRPEQPLVEDTPAAPSPYYTPNNENNDAQQSRANVSPRRSRPKLIPTEPAVPNATESDPNDRPAAPVAAPNNQSNVGDKINARYADPRVARMLQQLTPSSTESLYTEVSELI